MAKKFYITTAIAYMNAGPHAWHALEIVQTDALARMYRFLWYEVTFQTWSDEHGMKIWNASKAAWKEVHEFVNGNVELFKTLYKKLDISYDRFLQTSDQERHYPWAQLMRKRLMESWDLYKKSYKWLYCEGCEALKLEKDLISEQTESEVKVKEEEVSYVGIPLSIVKIRGRKTGKKKENSENNAFVEFICPNSVNRIMSKSGSLNFNGQKSKIFKAGTRLKYFVVKPRKIKDVEVI